MGISKGMLITELMSLESAIQEKVHSKYLAHRKQLEVEEQEYEDKERARSISFRSRED